MGHAAIRLWYSTGGTGPRSEGCTPYLLLRLAISRDGKDLYPLKLRVFVQVFGFLGRLFRFVDIDDQVEACRRIFASDSLWTVVRCSDMEEGPSEGLPVWSRHVGDPVLESNLTRRIDFALFMVHALTNPDLIYEAPAIVGRKTESARAHASSERPLS